MKIIVEAPLIRDGEHRRSADDQALVMLWFGEFQATVRLGKSVEAFQRAEQLAQQARRGMTCRAIAHGLRYGTDHDLACYRLRDVELVSVNGSIVA